MMLVLPSLNHRRRSHHYHHDHRCHRRLRLYSHYLTAKGEEGKWEETMVRVLKALDLIAMLTDLT